MNGNSDPTINRRDLLKDIKEGICAGDHRGSGAYPFKHCAP